MSDSKLHLMSFAPVPDTKTTVHVVGLPDSLRDALFTLMPPRKEGGYLNTKVLKDDLRCWLDRAVELNPVRPNVHTDSWLIALAPIDLAKLCNVIAVWISSRKDIDTQSPAYRKVMGMLHPETFEEAVRGEEIRLFSGDGRPTGRLTFPAFSAQVADAIADIPLELANGMVENFSRVSRGNGNVYELISDIHWHKEDPWAFALRFHVETLPVGRKARLNMDVAVRRFIGKPWQDDPFLEEYPYEFSRTESVDRLREALGSGNWAIRQGFCYRDLAFIQQVNGGDEWWTLKRDGDAWTGFESWSFGAIAQEPERFERAMRDMCEATPEQCRSGEWAHLHEKAPEPLAQRAASAREASRAHAGQEARAPMARERAVGAE